MYKEETEKVDIYSMGNVFYTILTGLWPFEKEKDARQQIIEGKRPYIARRFKESNDPADHAMLKAISMCWKQDPANRATAKEVVSVFYEALIALGIKPEDVI